jgi:ATP-binding cassette subfamily B protein
MASLPSLKELKFYFAPYRLAVYLGLFCLLLTNLGQNFIPLLLKHSIDELKQQNQDWKSLRWFLAGIVVLAILQATFRILSRLLIFNAARKVEYQLRNDLFAHLQKLPMTYFNQMSVGQIIGLMPNRSKWSRFLR